MRSEEEEEDLFVDIDDIPGLRSDSGVGLEGLHSMLEKRVEVVTRSGRREGSVVWGTPLTGYICKKSQHLIFWGLSKLISNRLRCVSPYFICIATSSTTTTR